jgi:succinate dehydrogenase / fumarate reductase flavoprotein subunit
MGDIGVHPDIAGYEDLAQAFDPSSRPRSPLARRWRQRSKDARPRGCHNRCDSPGLDESLQVNLVWPPTTGVTREEIPPIPSQIATLMREVSTAGKFVE